MLNIKCKDCIFEEVVTDRDNWGGCPTCDYGSKYINDITYKFNVGRINVEITKMYDYAISEGDMMSFWLNNIEKVKQMTFKEICHFLGDYYKEIGGDNLEFSVKLY